MRNDIVIISAKNCKAANRKSYIAAFDSYNGVPKREEIYSFLNDRFPENTLIDVDMITAGNQSFEFIAENDDAQLPETDRIQSYSSININAALHEKRVNKICSIGDVVIFLDGIVRVKGQIVDTNPLTIRSDANQLHKVTSDKILDFVGHDVSLTKNLRVGDTVEYEYNGERCIGCIVNTAPITVKRDNAPNLKLSSEWIKKIKDVGKNTLKGHKKISAEASSEEAMRKLLHL